MVLILALAAVAFSGTLVAASGTLAGGGDGDWVTGGTNGDDDWSGASYPGFGGSETANFDGTSTSIAVSSGNLPANAVTIEVNGGDATIDVADGVTLAVTDLGFVSGNNISFTNTAGGGATVTLAGLSTPSTTGTLTVGSNVTLQIGGAADFTGLTVTNNGTIEFNASLSVTAAAQLGGVVTVSSGTVTLDGGPGASTLNVSGGATAAFTAACDFSSTTVNNSGTIDLGGSNFSVAGASSLGGVVTVSGNTVTLDGGPGASTLNVSGGATAAFNAACDFSSTTVNNSGTVDFGGSFTVTSASAVGGVVTVSSGTVTLDSGPAASTLNVSASATATFTGATVDFSSTTVNNSGTVSFNGTSNGITVNSSSALNGAIMASGGNAVDFAAGLDCTTLGISGAANHSVTGTLTLSSTLTKSGSGTFSVSSTASFSGNVTVSTGDLSLSDTEVGTTGAGGTSVTLTASSGTSITVNGNFTVVVATSGNNLVHVNGVGTYTVTGDVTVAAATGTNNGSALAIGAGATLNCEGGFSVAGTSIAADGGAFQLAAGSSLVLGPNGGSSSNATFNLGQNSAFQVTGSTIRAAISVQSTNAYSMIDDGNATIDGLDIGGYDSDGLQLTGNFGSAGSAGNSVNGVTFQNGQTGGTHLTVGPDLVNALGSVSNATWTEILFDDSPGSGGNIAKAQTVDTSSLKISNTADEYSSSSNMTAAQAEGTGNGSLGGDNDGTTEATNITWGATNSPPVLQSPNATGDISVGGMDPSLTGSVLVGGDLAISFQATDVDAANTLTLTVSDAGTGSLNASTAGFSGSFPAQNTGTSSVTVALTGTAATTGNVVLQVDVDDGVGGTDTYTIDITISAVPTITVTSPNGGESFLEGGNMTVSWTSAGIGSTVDILLSINNGSSFAFTLASGTSNDGSETVTVPGSTASTTCLVRVRDSGTPSTLDDSNATFTITVPTPAAGSVSSQGNPGIQNANPGSTRTALGFRINETGGDLDLSVTAITITVNMSNNTGGVAESAIASIALRRGSTTLGTLTSASGNWSSTLSAITLNFTGLSETITAGTSADFLVTITFAGTASPIPNPTYSAVVMPSDVGSASTISGATVTGGTITLIDKLPDDPLDKDNEDDNSCDLATRGGPAWPLLLFGLLALMPLMRRRRETDR